MDTAIKEPVKKARTVKLTVYVSIEEDEQLQWAADEVGITKSSYVRMTSLKDAKEVLK